MFCYQCEETINNKGCTIEGMCGKNDVVANLQDLLIYILKGISIYGVKARNLKVSNDEVDFFVAEALFSTITNVNFDSHKISLLIKKAFQMRDKIKDTFFGAYKAKHSGKEFIEGLPDAATWYSDNIDDFIKKASSIGILSEKNEDMRSLKELLIYGLKGIAAYMDHAYILKEKDNDILAFLQEGLAATIDNNVGVDDLLALIMKAGEFAVKSMALLDKANTQVYGAPEISEIYTGTKEGPGILVSGHDLLDLEEILKQAQNTGINVYTHGELLPANAYPGLKKYKNLIGNYGTSWYNQRKEFEEFNGAIVMTTNCLQRPKDSYKDRLFTTGLVAWPGVQHIPQRSENKPKDFSEVIKKALILGSLKEKPGKRLIIGFAHKATLGVADKIVDAVKSGAIKRFVVMAGCDGRLKEREYFTKLAEKLPKEAVILTAGCAKYRYNMLDLGDIGGIPRVIDAGQCNDSYSLVVIAQKLAEVFGVKNINELPISFDIGWYEQKAVCVLLALLSLGVKGIRLGPRLPAFVSPAVLKVLVEKFDIKPITNVENDIADIMQIEENLAYKTNVA